MNQTRLALGTVQFGLPYGLGRPDRPVDRDTAAEILAAAWRSGVDMLDTAIEYGHAERVIGEMQPADARFAIVTKVPRLGLDALRPTDIEAVSDAVRESMTRLRVSVLDALLVHHAPDLLVPGADELFALLASFRDAGITRRIGVSVYDPEILSRVLEVHPIEVVQLPLNLFDQRFAREGVLDQLNRRGVEVHVRSVFLQGVLLLEPGRLHARFAALRDRLAQLDAECARLGISRAVAAFRFATLAGVDRIVIGVDNMDQLRGNLEAFAQALGSPDIFDTDCYAVDDPNLIDPRRWSQ